MTPYEYIDYLGIKARTIFQQQRERERYLSEPNERDFMEVDSSIERGKLSGSAEQNNHKCNWATIKSCNSKL